jgi:hypothetical protein
LSTGDFNGDHKLDLLVTYASGSCPYVSIFLGNGDGTFQEPPINTTPSYSPSATGVGDFNRDGKLDLAVAEQFGGVSQVEILLGNGDGTFSLGATYPTYANPSSVAVADFRRNGKLDFAVASLNGTEVFLGNGDGTFHPGQGIPPTDAAWVTAADFNGDGKPDLAVVTQGVPGAPSGVYVAVGNGDGTFQAPVFYPGGKDDSFVSAGDFNGDHKTDILFSDYRDSDVVVLLNTGAVSFSPTTPINYSFQLVGTSSPPQTVKVTNTGSTALSISSLKIAGPFNQTNTCGKSVGAGLECKIEIIFKPQSAGNAAGTVTISDSASSKPQVIELTGAGTVVKLAPAKLTFSAQKVGTKSAPQNVTLTNQGSTALSVTQIYVGGNNYKDFSETNTCPSSLNAGASCTITVTFDPLKTGTRTAQLGAVDTGGGSPQTVPLTGTGD